MSEVIRCRGSKVCSPFVDPSGAGICYVSAGTGEVFRWQSPDTHTVVAFTGGEPFGAQFDSSDRLHVADCGHAAVLRVDGSSQPGVLVKTYEECALRGPNGLAFAADGSLFFTDSGPLGETTLERPQGSVYCIAPSPSGGQVLRPLALECLAHPWGVAVSTCPDAVYVAETMRNRVLRLRARPNNAYHVSVFYQFAGGLGPSCIACDLSGTIYVGHYDFTGGGTSHGRISVISCTGVLQQTLEIQGTEITGICLSADEDYLIVTEASTNSIHRVAIR